MEASLPLFGMHEKVTSITSKVQSVSLSVKLESGTGWSLVTSFGRKKNLLARLSGVEKVLAHNPSQRMINLHSWLSKELDKIMSLEEELWGIKARTDWLIHGERNTTFLHLSTLIRKSHNRINQIMKADGEWEDDIARVKDIFIDGFERLYKSDKKTCLRIPDHFPVWGHCLSESEACNLAISPSDAEILFALKSMKAFKAPGPNGLHAGFFQRFWLIVGESVKIEIKKKKILLRKSLSFLTGH